MVDLCINKKGFTTVEAFVCLVLTVILANITISITQANRNYQVVQLHVSSKMEDELLYEMLQTNQQ